MTRQEAEQTCKKFAQEHPDRDTHQWFPRVANDGGWEVVKISLPPRKDELVQETRADERPPTADDPRPNTWRDLGGPNVG